MGGTGSFREKFHFDPQFALRVGVEREHFIVDRNGHIAPLAARVLEHIHVHGWGRRWGALGRRLQIDPGNMVGYELSACQIETRTRPVELEDLKRELTWQDREINRSVHELSLGLLNIEVAPDDMPLDVYPDPTGRYAAISAGMSHEVLLAACQVAGTHVHIGMPDHETVLRVYNSVIRRTRKLIRLGDGSHGRRVAIYRKVKPDPTPLPFEDWDSFYQVAQEGGFAEDPRSCWTWIRISRHGTIEFRMFGATPSLDRIFKWASLCHRLCRAAMH
jgi:hypothetical protein